MLQTFKSTDSGLATLDQVEDGSWINIVNQNEQEIVSISQPLNIPAEHLKAALNEEESFRLLYPKMILCVQSSWTVQYLIQ